MWHSAAGCLSMARPKSPCSAPLLCPKRHYLVAAANLFSTIVNRRRESQRFADVSMAHTTSDRVVTVWRSFPSPLEPMPNGDALRIVVKVGDAARDSARDRHVRALPGVTVEACRGCDHDFAPMKRGSDTRAHSTHL